MDSINAVNTYCNKLEALSDDLRKYAMAFAVTGNISLSKELYSIAFKISSTQSLIQKEVSLEIDRQYKQSVQSSANVFNSALAGITLTKMNKG
jgi:hypothetical protein